MPGRDGTGPFGTGPLDCGNGPCSRQGGRVSFWTTCRRFLNRPLLGRHKNKYF